MGPKENAASIHDIASILKDDVPMVICKLKE